MTNLSSSDLFEAADARGCAELHFKRDETTGMHAVVAIHNTTLGPSLGGCRFVEYPDTEAAWRDAMKLAQSMSYKSAIADLPLGGGKAVLMKPKHIKDREALFKSFGRFVAELNGRYITAMDSGTLESDMEHIASETPYVASHSNDAKRPGDPRVWTALGTIFGMKAAIRHQLKTDSFQDLHIVLQGVGNVGFEMARYLHEKGARLSVYDVNPEAVARCEEAFNATPLSVEELFETPCDIFAPCALGGAVNAKTLDQFQTSIIAGCANNQLRLPHCGQELLDRGMLYAPDYVINAGGVIYACALYLNKSDDWMMERLHRIETHLLEIFERSENSERPTHDIADEMALEILARAAKD